MTWCLLKVISVGYSFEPKGLSIAPKTLANFLERITLYEQGADIKRIWQCIMGATSLHITHIDARASGWFRHLPYTCHRVMKLSSETYPVFPVVPDNVCHAYVLAYSYRNLQSAAESD